MHWIGWMIALLFAVILIQIIYYQNRKDAKLICDYLYHIDKKLETLTIKLDSGKKIIWNGLDNISSSVGTIENRLESSMLTVNENIEKISNSLELYLKDREDLIGSLKSPMRQTPELVDQSEIIDDDEETDTLW